MTAIAVPETLLVLPVQQPDADRFARGDTRQISRNFAPDEEMIGRHMVIQATTHRGQIPPITPPEWVLVALGKLTGAGYYPGFARDPIAHVGRRYRRESGHAGAWVWTFTNVKRLKPMKLAQLGELKHADRGHAVDNGDGSWWCTCLRELDRGMVDRVRSARRKG